MLKKTKTKVLNIGASFILLATSMGGALPVLFSQTAHADPGTTVVTPNSLATSPTSPQGWYLYDDQADALQSDNADHGFVSGPATPPVGSGSVHLTKTTNDAYGIATNQFAGTTLNNITDLSYSTYRTSGADAQAPSLGFDIDSDTTDGADTGYQGRLSYEPYLTQTVNTGAWQTWNTQNDAAGNGNGNWWFSHDTLSHGAANQCTQADPCTWTELNTKYPHAAITGRFILRTNGADNQVFDGNVDNLTFNSTTYNFDPAPKPVKDVTTGQSFDTIQAAIDACSATCGDTITVAAGDYPATVNANKPVNLEGAQTGTLATSSARSAAVNGTDFSAESKISGTVTVSANNVTLDGFAVDTNGNHVGINITGNYADYTVENNVISNNSFGILLNGTDTSTGSTISGNAIVNNNKFTGEGHGISVQTVTKNLTIKNNYLAGNYNAAGNSESVNFYGLSGNSFHTNITITGNTAYDSSFTFASLKGLAMSGNDIEMADTFDSTAVYIAGDVHDATLTGNTLKGTSRDVYVAPDNFGIPAVSTNIKVNNNSLLGASTNSGVEVASGRYTGLLDATNNFWGGTNGPTDTTTDASQPVTNPSGTGSKALGAVKYEPYCLTAACTTFGPDSTAPQVTFTSPTNGSAVKTTPVSGTITDDTGVTQYSFHVTGPNGVQWDTGKFTPNQKSVNFNLNLCANDRLHKCNEATLPDGNYHVQTLAYDGYGHDSRTQAGLNFVLDTTAPDGSFNVPTNYVSGTTSIKVNLTAVGAAGLGQQQVVMRDSNAVAVGNWQYEVNTGASRIITRNATFSYSGDDRSGTLTITFNTTGLDGTYDLRLFTKDQLGNGRSNIYGQLKVDNSLDAPTNLSAKTTSGTTLASGDSTNSYGVTVSWDGPSDATTSYIYKVCDDIAHAASNCTTGTPYQTGVNGTSRQGDFTEGEGTYNISVASVDAAGNQSAFSVFSLTYDKTAPVLTVKNQSTTDQTPTIKGTVDDPSLTVKVNVDGHNYTATPASNGKWSVAIPKANKLSVGTYTVTATATDAAGNTGTGTGQLTITAAPGGGNGSNPGGGGNGGGSTNAVRINSFNPQTARSGNAFSRGNTGDGNDANTGDATNQSTGVLGANIDNSQNGKDGSSDGTKQIATVADHQSNFLGLGYWWIAVAAAAAGLFFILFGRRRHNDA